MSLKPKEQVPQSASGKMNWTESSKEVQVVSKCNKNITPLEIEMHIKTTPSLSQPCQSDWHQGNI